MGEKDNNALPNELPPEAVLAILNQVGEDNAAMVQGVEEENDDETVSE